MRINKINKILFLSFFLVILITSLQIKRALTAAAAGPYSLGAPNRQSKPPDWQGKPKSQEDADSVRESGIQESIPDDDVIREEAITEGVLSDDAIRSGAHGQAVLSDDIERSSGLTESISPDKATTEYGITEDANSL